MFIYYLKKAFNIILLDRDTISQVKNDKNATVWGLIFLTLTTLIFRLFEVITKQTRFIQTLFELIVFDFLLTFLVLLSIHLLARLFRGKGNFINFFRVYALGSIWILATTLLYIPFKEFFPSIIAISIYGLLFVVYIIWTILIYFSIIKGTYNLQGIKITALIILWLVIITLLWIGFTLYEINLGVTTLDKVFPGAEENLELSKQAQELKITWALFGVLDGERCYSSDKNVFIANKSNICFIPRTVWGFKRYKVNDIWFNIDYFIRNSSGDIILIVKDVYGSDGLVTKYDTFMYEQYNPIYVDLGQFSEGNYTLGFTIYDKVAKKYVTIEKEFFVRNSNNIK